MGSREKRGLALLGVAVVGALVLFQEEPAPLNNAPVDLVDLSGVEMTAVTISGEEGLLDASRTDDGIWTITAPFDALGSSGRFEELEEAIDALEVLPVAGEGEAETYGFTPPHLTLVGRLTSGEELKLEIGASTEVGENRYLRLNGGSVHVGLMRQLAPLERSFATYPADAGL